MDRIILRSSRAADILEILERKESWLNRQELAKLTGKKRLSPNDVIQLHNLVRDGLVEMRKVPTQLPVGEIFEYRAVLHGETS